MADKDVRFVTIDSPPINLLSIEMRDDFRRLHTEVAADDDTIVVVFKSADPDYFVAHFDVTVFAGFPDKPPPHPNEATGCGLAYRTMPKTTIAQIEGRPERHHRGRNNAIEIHPPGALVCDFMRRP